MPPTGTHFARLLFAGLAFSGAILTSAIAEASTITIPVASNVAGSGMGPAPVSNVGDSNGNRYQQIYASSFFLIGGPAQSILEVALRPKQGALGTFIGNSLILSDLTVRLSTTPRAADTNFPNGLNGDLNTNHGADVQTVFQGPLTLTTDRLFGDPDVEDFDFRIVFQTPFLYRPGLGNLLLEVIVPAGATVRSNGANFPQLDSFTDGFPSMDGTASATDANLLDGISVGSNSTAGVVTQFNTAAVPEPATLTLFATGLAGVVIAARRRRVQR